MEKDFLSVHDLSPYEFSRLLDLAAAIKKNPRKYRAALEGRILAMIFQKPSLRTRMTFEAGMLQLGGEAIYLSPSDIQMGSRESAYDIGKNLERWVDGIMIRTFAHRIATDLAASTRIPVINALTDEHHPCQAPPSRGKTTGCAILPGKQPSPNRRPEPCQHQGVPGGLGMTGKQLHSRTDDQEEARPAVQTGTGELAAVQHYPGQPGDSRHNAQKSSP